MALLFISKEINTVYFTHMDEDEPRYDFEDFVETNLGLKEIDNIYCSKFQYNACHNRNCPLTHIKLDKAVVCKHWLRGLCKKGKQCEFLHEYDLKRMPECWFFSKYGECANTECYFLHIDPNSKSKECLWYKRGFCRNGNHCRNRHVKMKMCWAYYYGFCVKGPDCGLGHPKYEMPDYEEQRIEMVKDIISKPSNVVRNGSK